jgi:hypothetical protein
MSCVDVPDAYLDARVQGALDAAIHWEAPALSCDGMNRPDRKGVRVTFAGSVNEESLTLVFGIPQLAEGVLGRNLPVNVTLIRESQAFYSTQGDQRCTIDEARQTPFPALDPTTPSRRWKIEARGFCLGPARALNGADDAILIVRFDFRGIVLWEAEGLIQSAPKPATSTR